MTSISILENARADMLESHREGRRADLETLSSLHETFVSEAGQIVAILQEISTNMKCWLSTEAELNTGLDELRDRSRDVPTCNVKVHGLKSELAEKKSSFQTIIEGLNPLDTDSDLGSALADLSSIKEQIATEAGELENLKLEINELEKNLQLLLKLKVCCELPQALSALEKQLFIRGSNESFTAEDLVQWGTGLTVDTAIEALRLLSNKKSGVIEDFCFDTLAQGQ